MMNTNFIQEKISNYTALIAEALDNNDCISALKLRAVQKEFAELLLAQEKKKQTLADIDVNEYYKTKDAAHILGINRSNLTRNPKKYEGLLTSIGYLFPREKIDTMASELKFKNKPGKKPKGNM